MANGSGWAAKFNRSARARRERYDRAAGVSLAGAKVDFDYAQSMYTEAARRLNYVNTQEALDYMWKWRDELNRAADALAKAEERDRKRKRRSRQEELPF